MEDFVVETLPGEVLVYDQVHHRAHCLSPAAAAVWRLCDGGKADKARVALVESGATDSLEGVLAQLETAGLVHPRAVERVNRSRRVMLGKTAVAAGVILAAPVVYSIISPSVAQAASTCGTKGNTCCPVVPGPQCGTNLICLGNTCRSIGP